MTNDELCDLVEAIAHKRDREAFARLFRFFAPKLKGFGMRRGIDAATAEELAQETMLTLWRKAEMFDRRRATVSTWVFTIVRNKRIDMLRKHPEPDGDLDEANDIVSDALAPDEALHWQKRGVRVREALRTLPADQVQVLQKAFFEEKSHRDIAAELDVPLGTVKSRIRLGLRRLRAAITDNGL